MAGLINEEDVRSLREQADIAEVISDHTALKRAGSRLKGLCPFHNEKTPSFTVDQAQGFYHCFGCDASGDVYSFLQQAEALSFPEAVERLARRVGYPLRYAELSPGQRKAMGRRSRMASCVAAAADFYAAQLRSSAGATARSYLAARGLGEREFAHFRIGWAPDSWDALTRHLSGQGFDPQEVIDAGLARPGRRGPIDFFRARVLFPIIDASGKDVVAFGGRTVPGYEATTAGQGPAPKYINSTETELYKKSRMLYGLNWARAEIARREQALVVEGYMDVIGLHMAGVEHAVATCGTALTREHFGQLAKFADRVVLALDADAAGLAAAERARVLAEEEDVRHVSVLALPDGQDPADLAAEGPEAVAAALASSQTSVEFQLVHLLRTADTDTPEGQAAAYRSTFELLGRLPDRVVRYRYIQDVVAPTVGISADRIEAELDRVAAGADRATPEREPKAPQGSPVSPRRLDPQLQLERQVLQAALQYPELMPDEFGELESEDFTNDASRRLLDVLRRATSSALGDVLPLLPDDDTRARVRALALAEAEVEPNTVKIAALVADLQARRVQRDIEQVEGRLQRVREQLPADERRTLMQQLGVLQLRRRELTARSRP